MHLNTLSPAPGSKHAPRRVGRGIGSGLGKTSGKGHKGQKARSGGTVRPGFEGGQMPLQRRLPKFGFTSRVGRITSEVRTSELALVAGDIVNVETLLSAGVVTSSIKRVKIMLSGDVARALTIDGLRVSKGARAAIEAAGGKVIDPVVPAHAGKKKTKKVVVQG
jgi:large subunit ribosomal protein L15